MILHIASAVADIMDKEVWFSAEKIVDELFCSSRFSHVNILIQLIDFQTYESENQLDVSKK